MILSGKEIVKHLGKEIIIEPFHPERVNPNSYNLSLHNELMIYDHAELDMAKPNPASRSIFRNRAMSSSLIRFTWVGLMNTPGPTATSPCWKAGRLSVVSAYSSTLRPVLATRLCRLLDP